MHKATREVKFPIGEERVAWKFGDRREIADGRLERE